MNVRRFDDVAEFARVVEPFLLANEAAHCLQLGILATLTKQPNAFSGEPTYLAIVEDEGEVALAVIRTPPHNAIVSLADPDVSLDDAMAFVARDLRDVYGDALSGAVGPAAVSGAFAAEWTRLTGRAAAVSMRERIYQLDAVIPVPGVPGAPRVATHADRDLLARWIAAFTEESAPEPLDPGEWADRALAADPALRGTFLWERDGEPVSMVGYTGPTPHGMRIGPVYTPPEQRGHGYASACTAWVSQMLLDGGRSFCFLFTDLANPTSNKIYQAIGYRPVIDVDMYRFATA